MDWRKYWENVAFFAAVITGFIGSIVGIVWIVHHYPRLSAVMFVALIVFGIPALMAWEERQHGD